MIYFNEKTGVFHISGKGVSYLLSIKKGVRNLYWGAPINPDDADVLLVQKKHSSFDEDIQVEREEYSLWNGHSFFLPCAKASGEGGRAIFAEYKKHEIKEDDEASRLTIVLEDENMGLEVHLLYKLYKKTNILARSACFKAGKSIEFETAMSAALCLPEGQSSKMRWLAGKWGGECQIQESDVNTGVMTLQSRSGLPGPHFNPTVALAEPAASETCGKVWFGALAYSGNWAIHVQKSIHGNTHIVAGINDFDYTKRLAAGESFETPVFYAGFTQQGFGGMSRDMHHFTRRYIMPRVEVRPVIYNSWEATAFDVRVDDQKKLAEKAAQIGCELFVVDDGWFGQRHSDNAGLGDWYVNRDKFPGGLAELIEHVKKLGMRFGIWVEPEAVNPDSDLYRAHPDWIYSYPNSEPMQLRNQFLLNLSLPQVQDYLKEMMHSLLTENDISFIKWDMNRVSTDMQSLADGKTKELWYEHVKALYSLWEYVRSEFPHVEMETCSGGGGRVELGILQYAEQSWPSDNTDPYTRLFIQEGYTQFYPANTMMGWVTESPVGKEWAQRPLKYRFHSSMCGGLAVGSNINKYTDEQLKECAHWIEKHKQWRHIVQLGDLYRLLSPRQSGVSAVQYISENKQEVLIFVFSNQMSTQDIQPRLHLQGLDFEAQYEMEDGQVLAGSTLMNAGLYADVQGDFNSRICYFKKL